MICTTNRETKFIPLDLLIITESIGLSAIVEEGDEVVQDVFQIKQWHHLYVD